VKEAAKVPGSKKKGSNNLKSYYKKPEKIYFPVFLFYTCIIIILRIRKLDLTTFIKMKKILIVAFLLSMLFFSCAKGITPYEAAHGKAKCGRYLK
jgi:hypothetical protein